MKKVTLIGFFLLVLVVMTYQIITTSNESSLFTLMNHWGEEGIDPYPWFKATLWDFYANFLFIALFVIWKENSWWRSSLWIIFLAAMGSPGTALYALIKIIVLPSGAPLSHLVTQRRLY
ncbi:MAG: DUF1475 family protein [Bacteroidota bacterium]